MISLLQTADAVVVAEQTRMGLWQLFMSGGWLMWVLLILGGLTIFIFVERFMAIRKASEFDMNFMNRIRDYILDGKVAAAVDLCRKTNTPIARMIEKGIGRIGRPMSDVQSAIENVANLEVSKLETNLPILATIAGGAPMMLPPSPWSFTSLRLNAKGRLRPACANASALTATNGIPL